MLDYCPKRGKQNSQHKAHARRATRTRAPATSEPTTAVAPTIRLHAPMSATTRAHAHRIQPFRFPLVPVARLELARPTGHPLLRRACLPFHHTGIVSAIPRCRGALVPPVGLEPTRPNGHLILSQACLPIPSRRQKKKGAETNTRDNHATTVRPTSGAHAHQPHHRPAQPACADTLNRPTQTGPTYSPTPRAPWRKHPSATRTHPAHHPMPPHTPA